MPKQIFQRPAPVKHTKIPGNRSGTPFQDGWGRKKGQKPVKTTAKPDISKPTK